MGRLLIMLLLLFAATDVFSTCSWGGIWVWPESDSINSNGIIVIEGYESSMETVKSIGVSFPAYLQSENHKVLLQRMTYNEGGYRLNQVLLKPTETLQVGETYMIVVEGVENSIIGSINPDVSQEKRKKWVVRSLLDTIHPTCATLPVETGKELRYYGCGLAIYVHFSLAVADVSDCLVKAIVTDKKSKNITTYFLHLKDGSISVGHSMCSGAFDLDIGRRYEVEFQLMDASGNVGAPFGNKIAFTAPAI